MKFNFLTLFLFLLLLHALAIIQSCDLFMRCGDPMEIQAKVEGVNVSPYTWNDLENTGFITNPPFDRNNLRLEIDLTANDSLDWYASHTPATASFIIPSAVAFECADPILKLTEHIESISILQLTDTVIDVSSNFLVEMYNSDLYDEIEPYLAKEDRYELFLAYKGSAEGDELVLLIKTGLNDGRVFSDTLNIELK